MKRQLVISLTIGTAAVLITVATSQADPNLNNVPPHRHWVNTPSGLVEVGPRVCGNPELQKAFNQFHNNIHVVSGSGIGPAAPRLHNFTGADVLSRGC